MRLTTSFGLWSAGILFTVLLLIYFVLSAPKSVDFGMDTLAPGTPDSGAYIYLMAGCSSCHMAEGSSDNTFLTGGQKFKTNFGTFIAPNVSNSELHGIGSWDFKDFYGAVKLGQSPQGKHYFPAFPYTAYSRMTDQDIADLWAFWQTLPSVDTPTKPHEIRFPFNIRRNLGIWKKLYTPEEFVDQTNDRATYVVEALAHCAECHTPRDVIGGLKSSRWMRGAKNPSGKGSIPSIHPDDLGWSKADIVEYLSSGFTPDYDMAGGKMASVIENTSKFTSTDRALIADYLLRIKRD